jgi:hypothetical protein
MKRESFVCTLSLSPAMAALSSSHIASFLASFSLTRANAVALHIQEGNPTIDIFISTSLSCDLVQFCNR